MIDETSYKLPINNYVELETTKKQIVIGHTFNHDMKHVSGWQHRYNGNYKRTAAFTIDRNGLIFKHFDPRFQSKFFKNSALDGKSIVILLENDGWLVKDSKNNAFITWIGDIYSQQGEVIEKKWRGYDWWSSYTEKQLESAIRLVKMLCEEFAIPEIAVSHNTKIDSLTDYTGVLYKSNLEKHYTDLSPAWPFELFKNKLEVK